MTENILKKEFNKNDVIRIRNIINKKYQDSTKIQSGYSKEEIIHNEGDIWEEKGQKWTIKNGIKQNVTKLDRFKSLSFVPMFCPKCSKLMNHNTDKRMYHLHKMCMNCVSVMETQLKLEGKYEEYEKNIISNNIINTMDDIEKEYIEFLNTSSNFITEGGDIEEWKGKQNKEKLMEEFKAFKEKILSK